MDIIYMIRNKNNYKDTNHIKKFLLNNSKT